MWLQQNRERNRVACKARREQNVEANRARDRERYAREREKRIAHARRYYEQNRERVQARCKSDEGRRRARERENRKRLDHSYRLYANISRDVRAALKGHKARRGWETIVGYSVADLITHLQRQFTKGMGWHNMGEWHIDHIRPRSMFDFSNPGNDELRECWALTNLRPLWAKDNLRKGAKRTHLI